MSGEEKRSAAPLVVGVTAFVVGGVVIGGLVAARRAADRGWAVDRRTRFARNAALARVGGSTAVGFAAHRARRAFAGAERREELDRSFELKTTEQVVATLGNLKGALMKVGQLASYLDQGMPEHVRETLAQLQSDAPPMSTELVDATVAAELERHPDVVFATWDPTPIAAASIGQVHRALTHDGRAVAVKVQYPGVDEAISTDLRTADNIFGALTFLFPGLDPEPVVAELRERLIEELDYRREAENQRTFATRYRGHPTIHVPDVVDELCTGRVLTTELAEGVRFEEMLTWSEEERDLAAETIYRFALFGSLYGFGMFNGDPHPGNYLFEPGGRVTFLDYGLVKMFTPDELQGFEAIIRAVVFESDPAHLRAVLVDLGLLGDVDVPDDLVFEYFSHFYEFVRVDGEYTISDEYASETVRHMFDSSGPYGPVMRAANVPPAFVVIQRINLGLYAIFGRIGARANWRRIAEELWSFTQGPPATPMGEAVAEWERGAPDRLMWRA